MATVEIYTNNASTTVPAGAGSGSGSETWTVTSSAGFPAAATGVSQFHVGDPAAPSELIVVTNVSGATWTVTRGAEGTTPVAHAAGFTVTQVITAGGLNAVAYNPMTAAGDLIYGGTIPSAGTPARLAGGTTAIKQFLVQTGTGSVSAAPQWGTIASADMPAGTTSAQGALQLNGSATTIVANGTQAAGNSPLAAAANHVHPDLNLILAPAGATSETFPRRYADANTAAQASATIFVTAIAIPQGVVVNNITMASGTTAKGGGTHGWYVLADSSLIVRAVTADQTDAASIWGTANTVYTLATNSYTTTYTGLYYVGVMVAASTVPTFLCTTATTNSVVALTPVLSGACGGATQTTPPATGSTLASVASSSRQYYAYTS